MGMVSVRWPSEVAMHDILAISSEAANGVFLIPRTMQYGKWTLEERLGQKLTDYPFNLLGEHISAEQVKEMVGQVPEPGLSITRNSGECITTVHAVKVAYSPVVYIMETEFPCMHCCEFHSGPCPY